MYMHVGVTLLTNYKCLEAPDEMESSETDKNFQVSCFMGQDVKYLHTGIQKASNKLLVSVADY